MTSSSPAARLTYVHYWTGRLYNVYHWVSLTGRTVAHYVNLVDLVAITEAAVEWRDLAVDPLFTPEGRMQVLDEHELDVAPPPLFAQRWPRFRTTFSGVATRSSAR